MGVSATSFAHAPLRHNPCSGFAHSDVAVALICCSHLKASLAVRTASSDTLTSSHLRAHLRLQRHHHHQYGKRRWSCGVLKVMAVDDFGARDPFPAEIESNFGDKVLGNPGTEHIILIPALSTGLADRSCQPLPSGASPLSESEARALLRKIVGWRLVNINGALRLQGDWKLKNFTAGLELFRRIAEVAEAEGHHPDLHLEQWNKARAEIWSHSIGGLSENDFILASKIDRINTSDLVNKKNKIWA